MEESTLLQIQTLCETDALLINRSFDISETLGLDALKSSIDSFIVFLSQQYGKFIPGMNLEYRCYIVGLFEQIHEPYKAVAVKNILFPYAK